MTKIRDGAGTGNMVRVTSTNRLSTVSEIQSSFAVISAESGGAFAVSTQATITVGASVERGILFVQNDSATPLVIGGFQVGNEGVGIWRAYLNPTGFSAAGVAVTPQNLNLSSGRTFGGTAERGNGTVTVSGGNVGFLGGVAAGFNELGVEGALILGLGNSVALSFEDTSAASNDVEANILAAFAQ